MPRAVYPGSFDPMTNGHLDIVAAAAELFDNVIVAVLNNPDKKSLFSVEERMELIRASVKAYTNVSVDSFSGLLADYTRLQTADVVVRGLRSVQDFEAEIPMAHMNRRLNAQLRTVFLPASLGVADISSSLVKQIAMHGGALTGLVPDDVARALKRKYHN